MKKDGLTVTPMPGTNIIWKGKVYGHKDIEEKIDALKSVILGLKINGSSLVGLLVPRSEWQVICPVAVLECSCAYIPLNIAWSKERIQSILNCTIPEILIVDKAWGEENGMLFHGYSCRGGLGSLAVFVKRERVKNPAAKDLAYIIFTSGTTGSPKGVMISRRALQSFKESFEKMMLPEKGKSILSLAEYSFDMFVPEGILALSWGLNVIMAETMDIVNPRRAERMLLRYKPDYMQVTPSALSLISVIDPGLSCLASISKLMVGAESFPEDLFEAVKRNFKGSIYNLYGPTEATVWCCGGDITGDKRVNAGQELEGCEIAIIGEEGEEKGSREKGEICIAGAQLAEGYWDNEEEDGKKFFYIKNKKFYRSGDTGYRDEEGKITCLGRMDDQIKLHGYRIELGEIESVSRKFAGVADAVAAVDHRPGEKRLVVFLTVNDQFEEERFWRHLEEWLPAYEIPAECICVKKFVYSENGKVNRQKMIGEMGRIRKNGI